MYLRETTGRYTRRRHAIAWIGHGVFLALPWLPWHASPLAMLAAMAAALALLLGASALVGRLWCGYVCPHTAYAVLYLWIERRIEGGRGARMRRDAAPLALPNLSRKLLKHGAWLSVSLLSGFTLAAYCVPAPLLFQQLLRGAAGTGAKVLLFSYAALAYVNAGLQREFLCRYLCPLAPLQQALLNRRTRVIAYDGARGEPRGLRNAKQNARRHEAALGDCLDCTLCRQVCPTGGDIREGLRGDCLGCGACIDACDLVMDKRGLPRGLIRYARLDRTVAPRRKNLS